MIRVGDARSAPPFPTAAKEALNNGQLRRNVRHATSVIRSKRDRAVAELPDWEALRSAAERIKRHTLRNLNRYLVQFEAACTAAGGQVHWARDADEANGIIVSLVGAQVKLWDRATGACLSTFYAHNAFSDGVFLPDGRHLIIAAENGLYFFRILL